MKMIKAALIFGAGAAVGGVIGWFWSKHYYDSIEYEVFKYDEPDSDDISVDSVEGDTEEVEQREVTYGEFVETQNKFKEQLAADGYISYHKFAKSQSETEEAAVIEENQTVDEEILKANDDAPVEDIYVITPEQFAKTKVFYDKENLIFWELERILTDEDNDILDVPDLIGTDWESHIGEYEANSVCIRNDKLETDYVVEIRSESFYEMRE